MSDVSAWWRALPLRARDGALAGALTAFGQAELVLLADEVQGSLPLQHLAFAVITASLCIRRSAPLAAAVVVAAGLACQTVLGDAPAVAGFVAMLIVTYSVAQYAASRRDGLLGLLALLASVQLYPFVSDEAVNPGDEVANMAIPVVVWVFARLARERLDRAVLAEREAMAARERIREEEAARGAALAGERRRIAREMHDVVGHGVTLMLLHADAAQASLAGREPAARQALDVVLTAGRTALEDLHRMLRLLRDPWADEPVPGTLEDVTELVDSARAAGSEVTLTVVGDQRRLPSALEATAYRIVQESLTNVLKHAGPGRVEVVLRHTDGALEIDVQDDGRAGGGESDRPGLGLVGIRERVALFDGSVSAGPRPDHPGWRVRAVLPVPAREHAAA